MAATAQADSYSLPTDLRVTCLDAATGKPLWEAEPGKLAWPHLAVEGDVVIAMANIPAGEQYQEVTYHLDANTGELLNDEKSPDELNQAAQQRIGPVDSLPRNLVAADGTRFIFRSGGPRHLSVRGTRGPEQIVRRLEDYVYDLHVAGDLAVYTIGRNAKGQTGGGKVWAYNVRKEKIEWEFDAAKQLPDPATLTRTNIDIDGDRVIVSTDQTLFSLALSTGNLIWTTPLPRQQIRRYDTPWTSMARIGDFLIVRCYEDLFVVRALDGGLLWAFDAGPHAKPWPTFANGRFYIGTRQGAGLRTIP